MHYHFMFVFVCLFKFLRGYVSARLLVLRFVCMQISRILYATKCLNKKLIKMGNLTTI